MSHYGRNRRGGSRAKSRGGNALGFRRRFPVLVKRAGKQFVGWYAGQMFKAGRMALRAILIAEGANPVWVDAAFRFARRVGGTGGGNGRKRA